MKKFSETLDEAMINKVRPRHGIGDGFKLSQDRLKGFTASKSHSKDHILYSKIEDHNPFSGYATANHFWINKKTKEVDFHVRADTKPGKRKGERLYHTLDTAGKVGAKVGHHAYYDLMSGRAGDAAIMVHDNMSKGAVKLQKRIRKTFGDKVRYHTFDHKTNEAKPYTHGVNSSFGIAEPGEKITPYNIHKKIGGMKIVGMVPPQHRVRRAAVNEAVDILLKGL